jgi:cytochrome c1
MTGTPPHTASYLLAVALLGCVVLLASACGSSGGTPVIAGADPGRAPALIGLYGCGGCHSISGVSDATGEIGPGLSGIDTRLVIAGGLPNTPTNLIAWIRDPQQFDPGTLMPDLHVTPQAARDIAAYLYRH